MCYGQKHSSVEWDLIFHFRSMSSTCLSSSWGLTDPQEELSLECVSLAAEGHGYQKSLFISIGAFGDA